jgi:hypothetical protein
MTLLDSQFFPHVVTWKARTGHDGTDPSFTDTTISCRVYRKQKEVLSFQGQTVVSLASLLCEEAVSVGDMIVLDEQVYPVLTVEEFPDIEGETPFRKVYI